MSKVISVLVLIALLAFLVPAVALAQGTCHLEEDLSTIDPACVSGADVDIDDYGMCCLINAIYVVAKWVTFIIGGIVGLMVIVGGFLIATAGGSPEKVKNGRNYILYAVIGMMVAIFARAIPSIAKRLVGM